MAINKTSISIILLISHNRFLANIFWPCANKARIRKKSVEQYFLFLIDKNL